MMMLRAAIFCCVLAVTGYAMLAQEARTAGHHDKLVGSWIVHYDRDDDIAHFPKAKRKSEAIRLFITKRGNDYHAQLRRFVRTPSTGYTLAGGWNAPLTVEGGAGGHRKRIAFYSAPVTPDRLEIKGVWQTGKNKTRQSERIQLLRWIGPMLANKDDAKKGPPFTCDEEPDSDVLEEEDPPVTDPNDPPPDPDP